MKVKVWKVENVVYPGNFLVLAENQLDALTEDLRYYEPGDKLTVTIEEWDEDDLKALPEWGGW